MPIKFYEWVPCDSGWGEQFTLRLSQLARCSFLSSYSWCCLTSDGNTRVALQFLQLIPMSRRSAS